MRRELHYVAVSERQQDIRNWSRVSGGVPAGSHPTLADVVVLDGYSGDHVDLRGVICGGFRISGFKGVVVMPDGGVLDLSGRKPRRKDTIAEWLRITNPPEPAMSQFTRERLLFAGWSWQAAVRMRLASLHGPRLLLVSRGNAAIVNLVTYYWVGGSGTWDGTTTTHWSLASGGVAAAGPPTAADIATFDANSGLGSGTATVTIAATAVCGGCSISGINSKTVFFSLSGNPTWSSGTYSFQGNSQTAPILFQSSTVGTTRTLTINGTYGANSDVSFMDVTVAGTGGALAGTRIGDGGGNSGITFTPSATQTWNGTSGGNWSTNAWTSRVPLLQDDVVISSAFLASQTVTADMPRLGRSIDWTGTTGNPTLSFTISNSIYGSLTLAAGMTTTGSQSNGFFGRSSFIIKTNGVSLSSRWTFIGIGGTYTLQDDFTCTDTGGAGMVLAAGTFAGNGHNVTANAWTLQSTSITRVLNMGSGTWTLTSGSSITVWNAAAATGLTINAGTSIILITGTTGAKTFAGNGFTYGTLQHTPTGNSGFAITGNNTFAVLDLECTTTRTVTLPAGGTQMVTTSFTRQGASGQLLSFVSSSPGTVTTIVLLPGATETSSFNTLSADVIVDLRASIAIGGGGSLAATISPYQRITPALLGAGSLAASMTEYQAVTPSLAGAGSIDATVTAFQGISASLAGSGSIDATVMPYMIFSVPLAGAGMIEASFMPLLQFPVGLNGLGQIAATITPFHRFLVALAGTSTLAATVYATRSVGAVTLAGTGDLNLNLTVYQEIVVPLAGGGSLSAIFYSEHLPSGGSITDFSPFSGTVRSL